jgi:hypothetical protein
MSADSVFLIVCGLHIAGLLFCVVKLTEGNEYE